MFGTLYIVSTPIGNLQDISLRAARTLLTVPVIACEDTRKTGILLSEVAKLFSGFTETQKPSLISYYDEVELQKFPQIVNILKQGTSVALVSDAGTPLISDPGFKLVREVLKEGIKVESIPGPSSVISALVVSGLPTDKFFFVGYPPKKEGHRLEFWKNLKEVARIMKSTIIFFEAPHRIVKTLEELKNIFGEGQEFTLIREMTKIHEERLSGTAENLISGFKTKESRGEFVGLFNVTI